MRKLGVWWTISILTITGVIGWYLSVLFEQPLVFTICLIIVVAFLGYLLTREQARRDEEKFEAFNNVISKMETISVELEKEAELTIENIKEAEKKICDNVNCANNQFVEKQEDITNQINKLITENNANINNSTIQLGERIDVVECALQKVVPELQAFVNTSNDKIIASVDKINEQIEQETQEIKHTQNVLEDSLEQVMEIYEEIEKRMGALEQQNVHLQQLTTLIGTVRSDIAVINEIRGFSEEAKVGRKVRIVRDDENKIVVENLMNSDGVRIEKSKMYRDKQLVFEAEFNSMGKMEMSRSYDKNGDLDTEVTYATDDHGRPTLREIAQEKITGFMKMVKNNRN